MAESYRGLTIRIGGDTTKLNAALKSTNQAISGTQSQMRKLSDALKMDPSSLRAAQLQIGAFASQASNAATRLVTLNDAMRQVGDRVRTFHGSTSTISEMAKNWGNVSMKAAQARDYYAKLTETIATNYTELSKLNKETAKAAQSEFKSGFDIDKTDFDNMKELVALVDGSKRGIKEQLDSLKEIQAQYLATKDTLYELVAAQSQATDPQTFAELQQKMEEVGPKLESLKKEFAEAAKELKDVKFNGINFKFDNKNVDLESLKAGLQQAVAASKLTQEEADKLYAKFASLKEMFKEAWNNVQVANEVEGFQDLGDEATKAEAKVASLVNEMVKLSNTSSIAKSMVGLIQQFKEIAARGAEAKNTLSTMTDILKKDDGNVSAKNVAMRAYAEAVGQAELAVQNLQNQIAGYKDVEVQKLALSTKSLAAETQTARDNFKAAAKELADYEGELEELRNQLSGIEATHAEDENYDFGADSEYQRIKEQIAGLEPLLKSVREAFASASSEKDKFVAVEELRKLYAELEKYKNTLKGLKEVNIKPEVDVSALDGLEKALKALSNGAFDSENMKQYESQVKQTEEALKEAKRQYESLKNAAAKDPKNTDALQKSAEAFDNVVVATKAHVAALNRVIDSIPADAIDEAALAQGRVTEEYEAAKREVDKYKTAIIDLNNRISAVEKEKGSILKVDQDAENRIHVLNERLKELKATRDRMAAEGDRAFDHLVVEENTRRVEQNRDAVRQDQQALEELGNTKATPNVDEAAFMQVVNRIADAAKRMASEVVQAANEIDTAFRDMRKTVNGTEREFDNLMENAIEYSQHNFTSADQMLEMQALGGQLGIATENLEEFGRIASNLDISTDIDAETVALKLGQMSNILQLDIDGMHGFADALVRLGNNMPAQESAIMAVAQRFGAVAATANFSGDEVLAWSAAIAATGQRSEAAATAISNTVSGIEQAVANGGSDLKQFAAIAGMSADEFKKAWAESPTQTLRAFIEGLKTLKDSDESAVAALENMGITGVRQQQTLLALTQTIDSLDEALAMSSNAWNGISDQWGDSGDAANEAGKKAEGFSGALAILQNNAQNLAASLGDGMLPFIKLASGALELITDILNSMPAPIKTLVVALGGASIAFSTITPMLIMFSKGMDSVLAAMKDTSTIGRFISQVTGLSNVFGTAEGAGLGLAATLDGPMLLGIGVVIAAFTTAITLINEYNEQQETLREATEGLATATDGLQSGYDSYISKTAEVTKSTKEFKDAVNETIEAQATLAEKIRGDWEAVGKNEAQVDALVDRITELAHKSNLTAEEQKELSAAVQTFNNLTGNNVQVIDEQTGKLSESTDQIHKYARSWKDATENTTAMNHYGQLLRQLKEAEDNLAESEARNEANDGHWFKDMRDNASSASEGITNLNEDHDKLVQVVAKAREALDNEVARMNDLGTGATEVEAVMNAAGDSLANYGDLTDSELRTVVDAYHNASDSSVSSLERIKNALDSIKSGTGDAEQIAKELEEAAQSAALARAKEYKKRAKSDYNDRKAELDNNYNALKASLDASYNAQKSSFDAAYKQAQKAYDSQYKQAQKAYENDYNALKKKLDNELSALKKANEAKLKAVKDANDDEVDAFKKATDARLKEMEREYKAKLKLLELEYGKKDSGLDDQIAALEAETEAEKKAIEERNRADKVAELQGAVDKAKSRRKRAEAEKALNDYLQEIEAERNEESRKSEIDRLKEQQTALKDELADRKEQLKEEYDAEVEAYKEKRAAELEALQEANQAEYDRLKEQLTAQEEARKEANDTRLQNLKDFQTAQLEAMKEAQQEQLEAMKESQNAQLEALKASNTAQLQEQKAKHTQELQDLKAAQDEKYEQIKDGWTEELEGEKDKNAKKKAEQDASNTKVSQAQKHHLDELLRQDGEYTTKSQRIQQTHQQTLEQEQDQHLRNLEQKDQNSYSARQSEAEYFKNDMSDKFFSLAANLASAGESGGSGYKEGYKNGISGFEWEVSQNKATIDELFAKKNFAYNSGFEMIDNLRQGMENARNNLAGAASNIANTIFSYLHHSVPDKGPLSDDDKWGGDLIQNLIDGMADKEHDLRRQVQRMADVVEDGFNPTMSLDAAYEAIDTINKGHTSAASIAMAGGKSAPSVSLTLNMNLSDVSVRSDDDIERLAEIISQKMAAQTARQLAGRLG